MYHKHFGLHADPFGLSPRIDFLYRSEAFEESMAHLVYGVDNGEPVVMISGPVGSGKTMAIQYFLDHLGDRYETALVTNTRVDGLELLKLILDDLDVELERGMDKSDALIAFRNRLFDNRASRRRVLVVVDEAQNLPPEVLEEVRLLTNLGQGDEQPVQVVLVGQPELEDLVDSPGLAQLRQRIRVRYKLEPLRRTEIDGYLAHRLAVAGCRDNVFAPAAVERIYEFSRGIPRVVNTLANDGLLSAFVRGGAKVEGNDIEKPQPERRPEPAPAAAAPAAQGVVTEAAPVAAGRSGWSRGKVLAAVLASALVGAAGGFYLLSGWFAPAVSHMPVSERVTFAAAPVLRNADPVVPAIADTAVTTAAADTSAVAPTPGLAVQDTVMVASADSVPSQTVAAAADTAAPADAPVALPKVLPVDPDGEWCVHVSSFRTEDRARSYAEVLSGEAGGAFYHFETVRGVGWFRVFVGPYGDRNAALSEALRLKDALGLKYYKVVHAGGAQEP